MSADSLLFGYSHCSTGRDVVSGLFRKVSQDPSFWLHFLLTKRWQNFQLAILLFCPGYYTSGDSSKNWEVGEFQKRKQLRQSMSTFGFLVYVTYQCLHRRPGLEASAVVEGFDAASFFCCKKAFQKTKLQTATSSETSSTPKLQLKKSTFHSGHWKL